MTDRRDGLHDPLTPFKPARKPVRAALWSIYYYCLRAQELRRGFLNLGRVLQPMPLENAIQNIIDASDAQHLPRKRRVLRKLASAGLTNLARWKELTDATNLAPNDSDWKARVLSVQPKVWDLATSLHLDVAQLRVIPVPKSITFLDDAFAVDDPSCSTSHATLEACQVPNYGGFGSPLTTVTAQADLSRTAAQLARIIDPRSWNCFEHFFTERYEEVGVGAYAVPKPDPDPIGQPWTPLTAPHFIHEIVTVTDGTDDNIFENVLRITNFSVSPTVARLDFELRESLTMTLPSLALTRNGGLIVDSGYLEAKQVTGPPSPVTHVTMQKNLQFVPLPVGSTSPELDSSEILNYLAPAAMCMWVEDLGEGAMCATPPCA